MMNEIITCEPALIDVKYHEYQQVCLSMPKLSDSQLAANVRERNREANRKMRERYSAMGHRQVTVWISAEARAKADTIAKEKGLTLGEAISLTLEHA